MVVWIHQFNLSSPVHKAKSSVGLSSDNGKTTPNMIDYVTGLVTGSQTFSV